MRLQLLAPAVELAPYVRHYWSLSFDPNAAFGALKNDVIPDGTMQLIVHWGEPFVECSIANAESVTRSQQMVQLCGPSMTAKSVEARGQVGMIAAVFEPWAFSALVRSNVAEFCDQGVSAEAIFGAETRLLAEKLAGLATLAEQKEAFERFLLKRLDRSSRARDDLHFLRRCVGAIQHTDRPQTLSQQCRDLGVSERTFQRRFIAAIGLQPGKFRRILRLQRALSQLREGKSLVEVAASCGYSDQSHMTREFGELASMTPLAVARRLALRD